MAHKSEPKYALLTFEQRKAVLDMLEQPGSVGWFRSCNSDVLSGVAEHSLLLGHLGQIPEVSR